MVTQHKMVNKIERTLGTSLLSWEVLVAMLWNLQGKVVSLICTFILKHDQHRFNNFTSNYSLFRRLHLLLEPHN